MMAKTCRTRAASLYALTMLQAIPQPLDCFWKCLHDCFVPVATAFLPLSWSLDVSSLVFVQ